ncbi:MAG: hypothetical protein H0X29_01360 [Parachlamydiaceae bacterium]|nr:hypothetical protein [Parachlamydiaceae bacterium]
MGNFFGGLATTIGHKSGLAYNTHIAAEHMSQGLLDGGYTWIATKKIIKILWKITPSDTVNKVISQLTYLYHIQKAVLDPTPINFLAQRVKDDIAKLEFKESILLPSNTWGHAMLLAVTCSGVFEGRKKYKVVQFNEGNGLSAHHHQKVEDGNLWFQVGLKIKQIDGEELFGKKSHFIKDVLNYLFMGGKVEKIYEEILPQLKGTYSNQSDNSRLWSLGQLGGSCTSSSLAAFIRAKFSESSFKEFQIVAKAESLLKLYSQIKRGCGSRSLRKLVSLEILRQLDECDLNEDLKLGCEIIRKSLQSDSTPTKNFFGDSSVEEKEKSCVKSLKLAFKILRSTTNQNDIINKAVIVFDKFLDSSATEFFTKNELKAFIKLSNQIASYCLKQPFNYEGIYIATIVSCFIAFVLKKHEREIEAKAKYKKNIIKIDSFISDFHKRCAVLSLDKKFNTPYNIFIEKYRANISKDLNHIDLINQAVKNLLNYNFKKFDSFSEDPLVEEGDRKALKELPGNHENEFNEDLRKF